MNDRTPSRRLEARPAVPDPCVRYLERLALSAAERGELLAQLGSGADPDPRATFAALHRALAGCAPAGADPVRASVRRRLALDTGPPTPIVLDARCS